mmetsp:Transcript_27603/g.82477  ORF Transcript_27603/g.82477 Transcript_27603/m.82477 type:complete len:259 (-) Transcript_27603:136-912(-)
MPQHAQQAAALAASSLSPRRRLSRRFSAPRRLWRGWCCWLGRGSAGGGHGGGERRRRWLAAIVHRGGARPRASARVAAWLGAAGEGEARERLKVRRREVAVLHLAHRCVRVRAALIAGVGGGRAGASPSQHGVRLWPCLDALHALDLAEPLLEVGDDRAGADRASQRGRLLVEVDSRVVIAVLALAVLQYRVDLVPSKVVEREEVDGGREKGGGRGRGESAGREAGVHRGRRASVRGRVLYRARVGSARRQRNLRGSV